MKKLFLILFVSFIVAQVATAQPTGQEVKWVCNVGYSSDAKFTQDDKYIVATDGGDLIVIDAENGKVLRRSLISPNRAIRQIKLSKNDSLIYSGGDAGIFYVHKFSTLEKMREYTRFKDTDIHYGINFFDMDEDNSLLAFSNGNKELILYNLDKDSIQFRQQLATQHLMFFDNYKKLAVVHQSAIAIYNTSTMEQISLDVGQNCYVTNFDISPDLTKIVTCNEKGKVYIWDTETRVRIEEVPNINTDIELWGVKYLENSKIIYGGGTGKIAIYDCLKKIIIFQINDEGASDFVNCKRNSNFLIIGFSYDSYNYCLIDSDLITRIISNDKDRDNVIIYPNPVNSIITIDLDNVVINSQINYSISDINGVIYKTGIIIVENNKILLNVFDLSDGLYFLSLKINNSSTIYKFIKGK